MDNFKIVLFGANGVGKTSFSKQLVTRKYPKHYISTIGAEIHPFVVETNEGNFRLDLWDTSGQEKYSDKEGYYQDAHLGLLFFDYSSKSSLEEAREWYSDFRKVCPNTPIMVIGNKADIARITPREAEGYFSEMQVLGVYVHSVKTMYNTFIVVENILRELTQDPGLYLL